MYKVDISELKKERIHKLKMASVEARQDVCPERARYLTEAYQKHVAEPMIKRRAYALKNILNKINIFIEENQLLAGNHAAKLRAASVFPEYCCEWIFEEIDTLEKRPGDRFHVEPEVREEMLSIAEWWKGKTLEDRCQATLPEDVKRAYKMGILSASGNMTSGDGHIMLDFEKILNKGAQGIIDDATKAVNALDLTDPGNHAKRIFYESVIIAYQGVIDYANRYAALASELAEKTGDQNRKQELVDLSERCSRVPAHPAKTFRDGIQAVWFVHLISQLESNGHSMSFGRLDQYMYPFYKRDLASGIITNEEVVELLSCLWVKAFGVVKIRPWSHTRFSGGDPTYQNLTLGGITPDGEDAVNELTMMCLDSVALTRLPQPNVSARLHPKNPDDYLKKCIEIINLGFGMPAMHSDEMMIESLKSRGVTQEDANNYAICGCIEPIVPGKFGYRTAGMSFTNFSKVLEIALNGGVDAKTGYALRPQQDNLETFANIGDLKKAYKEQMEKTVQLRVTGEHCIDAAIEELVPDAFCSGLIQDCIGRGMTAKQGGSVYDLVTGPETGVVNAANSVVAIDDLVYKEKRLTASDLKHYLDTNFEGLDGENVRRMLLNRAPKFGNDIDEVDLMARDIYLMFIHEQEKYHTPRYGKGPIGCISYPCTATISGNVPQGVCVGASAEGRKDGEPLTEGCSPYHGTDKIGPTAVLRSVAKMPNDKITGGNLLNLKFTPSALASREGREKMGNMIKTFFGMNGWHVQFNIVSSETLRDAQKHPEEYKDLVVRVAGYSALFNDLEAKTQNDIIARTEHTL